MRRRPIAPSIFAEEPSRAGLEFAAVVPKGYSSAPMSTMVSIIRISPSKSAAGSPGAAFHPALMHGEPDCRW